MINAFVQSCNTLKDVYQQAKSPYSVYPYPYSSWQFQGSSNPYTSKGVPVQALN